MMSYNIALTALAGEVGLDELTAAAIAIQTQVMRDFFPEWGVSAMVSATSFEAVPAGTTPIIVQDDLDDPAANGFHRTRRDETPYIVVPYGASWPLAASHELLRMLANPSGAARTPGPSRMQGQGTVEYLVDVCGPCQDVSASYVINGIAVADFCTRGFFAGPGAARSHTGALRRAFEPAADGIVTWLADDDLLYQARADGTGRIRVHGGFSSANRGRMLLRELVDTLTPDRLHRLSNAPRLADLLEAEQSARRAGFTNMARLRDDIAWRFGEARVPVSAGRPSRDVRRLNIDATVPGLPAASCVVNDPEMTLRNASC